MVHGFCTCVCRPIRGFIDSTRALWCPTEEHDAALVEGRQLYDKEHVRTAAELSTIGTDQSPTADFENCNR